MISLFRPDIDQRLKPNRAAFGKPIRSPDIDLLTAALKERSFAIGMERSATRDDPMANIDRQLDIGLQHVQHLLELLCCCSIGDDVNHF